MLKHSTGREGTPTVRVVRPLLLAELARGWRAVSFCFLLVIVGGFPLRGWCQGTLFGGNPTWWSGLESGTQNVALGDVDGDGDLDLVCGNEFGNSTLYLNQGGMLEQMPSWSSGRGDAAYGVALGDIDGDGDLDLVCGNGGNGGYGVQSSTLYVNHGGALEQMPSWYSVLQSHTTSVALGDVDADGDLDFVCGNSGESTTLYLNQGGTLDTIPSWSAAVAGATTSVVFGDVDGDGDLDLVCGNDGQPTTLYLNQGGALDTIPSWSSGRVDHTSSVTLGDVDGDGDLDLVCGNLNECTTLYLNQGGVFRNPPWWLSELPNYTRSVALGDVDGDGDLDLICGNSFESTTLYLNQADAWGTTQSWSTLASSTYSVALGDVDRDGDLDLVCGNFGASTTLYLNREGTFEITPAWSSALRSRTASVAFGDVDGDGDLDLVCGNGGGGGYGVQNSTLYVNDGGVLETTPSWSSGLASHTTSVALGDVNGDGTLDLVSGNYEDCTTLYLNQGGTFETMPSWSTATPDYTTSVALGDIDGDDDLDLVCGSDLASTKLYVNQGGVLNTVPSWSSPFVSGEGPYTTSVAFGDINGDGGVDLVCGNYGQRATLYLNHGDVFEHSPSWSSGIERATSSVALGDVDGDGDLDLVCGNCAQSADLYLNQGEWLHLMPSWSSESGLARRTLGVALGDVDGDGDLDLVCGNNNEGTTLFVNRRAPAYKDDPLDPTNHLPNNAAHLRWTRSKELEPNTYEVHFKAVDVESDPIWLVLDYQHKGKPHWYPADVLGQAGKVGPFTTSAGGVTDSLEWDTHLLPFDKRDVILRLRTIEIPRRVSLIQHAASYLLDVGPIEPFRPQLSSSTNAITFIAVTVGDTAVVAVTVGNTGNLPLTVSDIELPSAEMRQDRSTPFSLAPGDKDTLRLFLEPRLQYVVSGDVRIMSNDPLTPVLSIGVTTDIRPLRFRSRLLNPAQEVPLGEALGFNIIPEPDVMIERGYVHYRPSGSTGAWTDSVRIERLAEGDFVATVPGEGVTEAGLEYYIKVENSGVFATDPPGAPEDSVFNQAVAPPVTMSTISIPNHGSGFLEGLDVTVQASLPIGASFDQGSLRFRRGGDTDYTSVALTLSDALPFGVIPGDLAGPRGLEYWVEVHTLTQTLTDPPGVPGRSPHAIRVTVPDLAEPEEHPGGRYRMFSIPLQLDAPITGVITDDLGGPDITKWRLFARDDDRGTYVELPNDSISSFQQGRGYWLVTKEPHRLDTGPAEGLSTPTDTAFAIVLKPDWNMIGDPFDFPVAWDSMTVDGRSMTEAESTVVNPPVGWTGNHYEYDLRMLEPWEGYWLKNLGETPALLRIPPREAVGEAITTGPTNLAPTAKAVGSNQGWTLGIVATSLEARDGYNYVGATTGAQNEWDQFDRSEAPMSPGDGIALYFPHTEWGTHRDRYTVDIRGDYQVKETNASSSGTGTNKIWGHTWSFDVAKNFSKGTAGDEVVLEVSGMKAMPAEAEILLVDRQLDRLVDLREENRYAFFQGKRKFVTSEEDTRFVLLVGSEDFVDSFGDELPGLPTQTVLHQNHPNPFNPSTIIRYELARPGRVTLRIYDVRGALVRVLEDRDRPAGRYEIGWNAENDRGGRVSSGVYFYQLNTPGLSQTRKMVILK